MRQKLYIQDLSHLSNLHKRLCSVLMRIEKKSTCWFYFEQRLQQCLKLKIPSKVLSDIFDQFANEVNFKNEDFRPKKDFSNQSELSTFENNDFVYFCIVVYQTLHDLYGDDGLKIENFEHSIEDLFSNKDKCPGFAKLVGKLVALDNFCDCCNNIYNINFDDSFENRFSYFRDLMKQASLRMIPDKVNNKIEIESKNGSRKKKKIWPSITNKNLNLKTETEDSQKTIKSFDVKKNKIHVNEKTKLDEINHMNQDSSNNKPPILFLKIFLLVGTIITFLAFCFFLLNAVLCFIPIITSIMSIIFTVVNFVLSLLQIFIAYKTDTIRLYKLCCCVKSNNKSFFNMRRNSETNTIIFIKTILVNGE